LIEGEGVAAKVELHQSQGFKYHTVVLYLLCRTHRAGSTIRVVKCEVSVRNNDGVCRAYREVDISHPLIFINIEIEHCAGQ
jgi:hypothetical protein